MIVSHEFRLHVEKNASYKMIFVLINTIILNTKQLIAPSIYYYLKVKKWFNIKAHDT